MKSILFAIFLFGFFQTNVFAETSASHADDNHGTLCHIEIPNGWIFEKEDGDHLIYRHSSFDVFLDLVCVNHGSGLAADKFKSEKSKPPLLKKTKGIHFETHYYFGSDRSLMISFLGISSPDIRKVIKDTLSYIRD